MARVPPPPPPTTAFDIIPWVGMIVAGIGAITSSIAKMMTVRAQVEAQREMAKAAQEYWKHIGPQPPVMYHQPIGEQQQNISQN